LKSDPIQNRKCLAPTVLSVHADARRVQVSASAPHALIVAVLTVFCTAAVAPLSGVDLHVINRLTY
jgi:hypothetical protein